MLHKTAKKLKKLTTNPEQYLIPQNENAEKIKKTVKQLYDFGKTVQVETQKRKSSLNELIIDEMDEEQIWQQLELNNDELLSECLEFSSNMLSINQLKLDLPYERVVEESNGVENGHVDSEDEEERVEEGQKIVKMRKKSKKKKSSIVDDKFFNLSEMEAFLEQEDRKVMRKKRDDDSGSEINYFEDVGDDSEVEHEQNLKYSEYFDPESASEEEVTDDDGLNFQRKVQFDMSRNTEKTIESDGDDSEEEEEQEQNVEKSSHEKRQEMLQKTIHRLEEKALQGKSWQLQGEISAQTRPENALLEEFLEFDAATRPAPIITEQTTMELEDIIKQRIKDRAFDDVVRKVKPVQSAQEYRKALVLDSEKSKESLAQIYEKEFLKAKEQSNPDADDKTEEEPEEHLAIRKSLKSLFIKLDALSNYHITPKPAAPEVKIITNTPAITMEEVAPVTMSNAALLAPEEVKNKEKGEVMSLEEMTKTDKARKQRKRKLKNKMKQKLMEEKQAQQEASGKVSKKVEQKKAMSQVMKNRNVEKMKETKGVKITSSSTFFSKLQEENAALGIKKKGQKKKKKVEGQNRVSAKALKL